MKAAPFRYFAPTTLDEAASLLADMGDDAKVLAGGQSLVPMLNMRLTRFEALIDITRITDLQTIAVGDGWARIGAGVRDVVIDDSEELAASVPLLRQASGHIGHFQIRSRGTLCGSVAHADPAAEFPAVALALDARMELVGSGGSREVPAAEFFTGTWTTVVDSAEILVATTFPTWPSSSRFAVEEVARREGDYAIAGAAVGIDLDPGTATITRAAIGLFGLGNTPLRAHAAEEALMGATVSGLDTSELGRLAVADLDPPGDLHASGALRGRIGATVVRRALDRVLDASSREGHR